MLEGSAPIGIFDSGIGGLTVAKAILERLPSENIIYFGDTAHLPYGDKSAKSIQSYCNAISHFLIGKGCKMIVVACNTASAVGFNVVKKVCGEDAIPINVIDPVVSIVKEQSFSGKLGIIGTKRTINTRAYTKRLRQSMPELMTAEMATPLLAPMIEEGFFNNKISQTIINSYLSRKSLADIDALILACTHYPLIQKEISNFYKNEILIIDSALAVANEVAATLKTKSLVNLSLEKPSHEFFVSDYTESFETTARIFFGSKPKLKEMNLWA